MSDVVVSVTESTTAVTVTEQDVAVAVTENTVEVSSSTAGVQGATGATGATGASGVVSVTSPITNTGTAGSAIVGIDQTLLGLTRSQISDFTSGTVTSISGTVTQAQVTSLVTDLAGKASLGAANTFSVGAQTINTGATANKGLVVQGVANQSANLFEVQTSSSTAVRINQVGNTTFIGNITSQNNATFTPASAATVPLTVQGAASQTASVLALQNSAGSITANFTAPVNNVNRLNLGGTDLSATFGITVHASGGVGQVIRGAASQTANLQEWQNSGGTVLASVSSAGLFTPTAIRQTGSGNLNSFGGAAVTGQIVSIFTGGTANKGLVVQGAASQTANLQEWQNSAGTVLARITSAGVLRASQVLSLNGLSSMGEFNNGAIFEFVRATAASYSPGANRATLYFRDGTNAGTLKLVVRAGAAGAETTILDNIPQ